MQTSELCRQLMRADTEDEVVRILQTAELWEDKDLWRYLSDNENNFSSIGNQQSEAIAALTEKLINGVDARLMNECKLNGIDPESSEAPRSIRLAVADFFEERRGKIPDEAGLIIHWPDSKITSEANNLTLAATGLRSNEGSGRPSLTISDAGEGQTPDDFPNTFLSLQRSNKLRVPFVQGKFNMGATGALQFCSPRHRLQLIISRRNPNFISKDSSPRDHEWGFTIVRREEPPKGARSSVFTYLAPENVNRGRDGSVLSFAAGEWPIFPKSDESGRDAYSRTSTHGSLVKLYEYNLSNRSNIIQSGGGLLQRIDFSLPELALPIRLYECRQAFRGRPGSFSTNVLGVAARLERDRMDKLENDFPVGAIFRIQDCEVRVRVYALKESAQNYRSGRNAITFAINGHTHATKDTNFFRRKAVGMGQLEDSLIVILDCSNIQGQLREDMFLNSRDRLRENSITKTLEDNLEEFLRKDPTLRALKNKRREEEIKKQLDEAKPLADALSKLIKDTPELSRLLAGGPSISSPFPKSGTGNGTNSTSLKTKRFPTYFRFHNKSDGESLEREAQLDSSVRIKFDTDAEDEYFLRDSERGVLEVDFSNEENNRWLPLSDFSLVGPKSGLVNLSFDFPDTVTVGDVVLIRTRVTDPSRIESFDLEAMLKITSKPKNRSESKRDSNENNSGQGKGNQPDNLAVPHIEPVHEEDWAKHGFDELSALKVIRHTDNDLNQQEFDFYANYDNKYLLTAQQGSTP